MKLARKAPITLVLLSGLVVSSCAQGSGRANAPGKALVVGTGTTAPEPAPSNAPEDDAVVPISARDAVRGQRLAPVTLVVFSDFQCPFCGRLASTFDRLRAELGDTVRVVFKNYPLPFHAHARLAAEVGQGVLELAGPDAFWRFHDLAFRRQEAISPESVRAWAALAGADGRELEAGLSAKRWAKKVDDDAELGRRLGVVGTPATFVNGTLVAGAQAYDKFKTAVDLEAANASALVARGVPRDKVYKQVVATNYKTPADDDEDEGEREALAREAKVVHKVPLGTAPFRGPATALVTIVEFADFQCPWCARVEDTLKRVRQEYGDKVRFVWRDRPLPFHPHAEPAAELARAARAQKGDAGFWAMHDLLFASSSNSKSKLAEEDLERLAREAKLDVSKAMNAVKSRAYRRAIDADVDLGDDLSAAGTPHFFVNGRRLVGAQPFEKFKSLVDEELAKAEALVRSGVPRAGVYEAAIKDGVPLPALEQKALAAASSTAPFRGAANAKIVIQEVGDFQCPFCARAEGVMDELLRAYPGQLKIVWRDKPLGIHPDARLAAEAAREAFVQKGPDGFEKMRRELFKDPHALGRGDLDADARAVGLDMTKFGNALDTHVHKAAVDADDSVTTGAGVNGTPAFFVGPYFVSGAHPFGKFRRLVDLLGGQSAARAEKSEKAEKPEKADKPDKPDKPVEPSGGQR